MEKEIFDMLDNVLKNTDLSNVTAESSGFSELPDGYYLTMVEKAELKVSSKGDPMVSLQLKVIEDGYKVDIEGTDVELSTITKTSGRKVFINYVLKNDQSIKRFVTDMLKFESSPGESVLPKEAFTTSETIVDALNVLVGYDIFVMVSTTENEVTKAKSTWTNPISWKRASILGLPTF